MSIGRNHITNIEMEPWSHICSNFFRGRCLRFDISHSIYSEENTYTELSLVELSFLVVNSGTEKGQFLLVSKIDLKEVSLAFFVILERTELYISILYSEIVCMWQCKAATCGRLHTYIDC